ncbi:serine hydrolase domain-containing protein [Streptomyces sp. FXJ1.4098]|nr:serine hydrolase domain-containing protein [Streptomyces sp. FXJ1.4098]
MLRALARTRLRAAPGTRVRYSNFGLGLLGHALTGAADGTPYPALLDARVLRPLGLRDTGCALSAAEGGAQATGYWYGRARPAFRIPGLPAAGALRTSARDLLALVETILDPVEAPARLPPRPPSRRAADRSARCHPPRVRLPNGRGLSWCGTSADAPTAPTCTTTRAPPAVSRPSPASTRAMQRPW